MNTLDSASSKRINVLTLGKSQAKAHAAENSTNTDYRRRRCSWSFNSPNPTSLNEIYQ